MKRGRPRKDSNEKKKNGLKHSFLAVTSATPTLEEKTMYMLAKLVANVCICCNVCIYNFQQRLYLLWNLRELIYCEHYKLYREKSMS